MNTYLSVAPPPRKKSGDTDSLHPTPAVSPDPVIETVADLLDRASAAQLELAVSLGDAAALLRKLDG